MSLFSENIIPGNHGKIFGTNAKSEHNLKRIKDKILSVDGVKDVIINTEIFPREFTVFTTKLVKVKDIQEKVMVTGFHVIPKNPFEL